MVARSRTSRRGCLCWRLCGRMGALGGEWVVVAVTGRGMTLELNTQGVPKEWNTKYRNDWKHWSNFDFDNDGFWPNRDVFPFKMGRVNVPVKCEAFHLEKWRNFYQIHLGRWTKIYQTFAYVQDFFWRVGLVELEDGGCWSILKRFRPGPLIKKVSLIRTLGPKCWMMID